MPSVSKTTLHLKDIIETNSELQDVWMQGEVSDVRPIRNGPLNFTLTDSNGSVECVIFNDRASLRENLPEIGNIVSVNGYIYVRGSISQYKFVVTDIKLPEDPLKSQFVSVRDLMKILEITLETHSGEVQGEILEVFKTRANYTILKLKDSAVDGQFDDIIECVLPPRISAPFPLQMGERVHVKGQFGIFANTSTYRIMIGNQNDITQVTNDTLSGQTTRNECQECHQHFDNLQDQLCHICYDARLTSEGIVVGAVVRYFNTPRFANFFMQREYPIRFGTNIEGRADVGLLNSQGQPIAIAECKRIGYDNGSDGIEQLRSYLNGSGAELGLFAVDTDPYEWAFFMKNRKKNRLDKITRSQFERKLGVNSVSEMPPNQTRLELIRGNIIETEIDAIVITATFSLKVDEKILEVGGEEIKRECQTIIGREGFLPPTRAVITTGGNLPAKHIIHTVAPIFLGEEQDEPEVLALCYKNSLQIAVENGIRSIAFHAVSTGNYGFPIERATPIALNAIREFVKQAQQNNKMVPERILFVLSDEEAHTCYVKEFSSLGFGLFSLME